MDLPLILPDLGLAADRLLASEAGDFDLAELTGAPPYQPDTVMKDLERVDCACKSSLQLESLCA